MERGKFNVVIGGQAGSESKGKLSGYLCDKFKPDLVVMTSSPNAGHTVILPNGEKKVSYHLPIGAVMCDSLIALGPASLINPNVFEKELWDLGINPERIIIDPRASIITESHLSLEKGSKLSDIGSTLQGISEARIGKMRRDGCHVFASDFRGYFHSLGIGKITDTSPIINQMLRDEALVLCETTQGFDLCLEHGIHPAYCTSKMINTSMVMAEHGVPPQMVGNVYGVIRPYPIRVNNRTGTSGPYAESGELTWEEVASRCGYPGRVEDFIEYTTTTKLPRRIFGFSWNRFGRFVEVCNPTHLCLQFANYIDWSAMEATWFEGLPSSVVSFIGRLEEVAHCLVSYIGVGPRHDQMIERVIRWI